MLLRLVFDNIDTQLTHKYTTSLRDMNQLHHYTDRLVYHELKHMLMIVSEYQVYCKVQSYYLYQHKYLL